MFSNIIIRNNKRSRQENGLFFSSLVISIVAFYLILSLSKQDVVIFLQTMESDAVNKLLLLVPVFYVLTLGILFFLIYFACKYQIQRRRHEFGVYRMLGMKKIKLFSMLLAEDVMSSIFALLIGLPIAIFLSEMISLVTAKLVGMGIIGHHSSVSGSAIIFTIVGFMAIKLVAFSILSSKICFQEIGSLLRDESEVTKKEKPNAVYILSFLCGMIFLLVAYAMAIKEATWRKPGRMFVTEGLGLLGTLLLFYGMRIMIRFFAKRGTKRLRVFNFRQLEENVIHQSTTLAISSLLILAALCCFGAGAGIAITNTQQDDHVLDYTFDNYETIDSQEMLTTVKAILKEQNLEQQFSAIFPMRIGHVRTTDAYEGVFKMERVFEGIAAFPKSEAQQILLNNLSYEETPFLLRQSDYNMVLKLAGEPTLDLANNEASVYISKDFIDEKRREILNHVFSSRPETQLDGAQIFLTGDVQTTNIVTDRSITLAFALILPDEQFDYYTQGEHSCYINGVLSKGGMKDIGLMQAISLVNAQLNESSLNQKGISYESYLSNMGRRLFYIVAASYITIYLAIIFLVVANTILGVQFLMSQRKSGRKYETLVWLGADYPVLCKAARSQVRWFMGIPIVVAALSSVPGVKVIIGGALAGRVGESQSMILLVSIAMIGLLLVVEWMYIAYVKRSSDRYLLTIMQPQREE